MGMLKQVSARPDCKTVKPCHKERKREEEQKKTEGMRQRGDRKGQKEERKTPSFELGTE